MGPGGGAESIVHAFSPAGHLFVNLIKEKWLLLSSSCSLSAGEPILYGDVAAHTAFPRGDAGNQQGCRVMGQPHIPCSCFTALGQELHPLAHTQTHLPAPEEGALANGLIFLKLASGGSFLSCFLAELGDRSGL